MLQTVIHCLKPLDEVNSTMHNLNCVTSETATIKEMFEKMCRVCRKDHKMKRYVNKMYNCVEMNPHCTKEALSLHDWAPFSLNDWWRM